MPQHFKNLNHKLSLALLIAFLLLAASNNNATIYAQDAVGDFEEIDCFFDTGFPPHTLESLGYFCGYVTVPEEHSKPDGNKIRLPVAIRKATNSNPEPDPVFLAQGGPGGDAFTAFSFSATFSSFAANRDIVVFNQRGTQYAQPDLLCEEVFDLEGELLEMTDEDEALKLSNEASLQCRERLIAEGINLSAYTSLENAMDIDIIRQALGYESYNFYGVSYGTLLGQHLLNLKQPALRSVILDSVVVPRLDFTRFVGDTANRAYDEYFAYCEQDATCSEMYPNLESRLVALYDKLNAEPAIVSLTDDNTGVTYDAVISDDTLRSIIFQLFYVGDFHAIFPRIISDLEAGDFTFIKALYPKLAFARTSSHGMYHTVVCSEEYDYSGEDINTDGLRPFISENIVSEAEELLDSCARWEIEQLPDSINDPVSSDVPVLLLSGRFDPITPASYADEAARTLSTSYNLFNPTGSHGNVINGNVCTEGILHAFLDDPTVMPDSSCLAESKLREVVPVGAVKVPILQKFVTQDAALISQFGMLNTLSWLLMSGVVLWPVMWVIRKNRGHDEVVENRREQIIGRIATILAGVLIMAFTSRFPLMVVQSLQAPAMYLYQAFPAGSRLLFTLPLISIILALVGIAYHILSWRSASLLGKIYQGLMIICLLGVSALSIMLRFIESLFS